MSDEKDMHPEFDDDEDDEAELEALRAKQAEMEKDAQQLMALQAALSGGGAPAADSAAPSAEASSSTAGVKEEGGGAGSAGDAGGSANGDGAALPTEEEREEVDARSIYIGNVDYGATPEEIQKHFQACGTINRVTILCDKFTGHPKGFAYVEFADAALVKNALVLNESMFRGRVLQVTAKRTNKPGFNRGRGRGRGGYRGGYVPRGGYAPYRARGRGRGRGY